MRKHYSDHHESVVTIDDRATILFLGTIWDNIKKECPICKRPFFGKFDHDHVRMHDKLKFRCLEPNCGWMFSAFPKFKNHYFDHHKLKLSRYAEQSYLTSREIILKKPSEGYAECSTCNRRMLEIYYASHLADHRKYKECMFTCTVSGCGWMYKELHPFRNHCLKKHNMRVIMKPQRETESTKGQSQSQDPPTKFTRAKSHFGSAEKRVKTGTSAKTPCKQPGTDLGETPEYIDVSDDDEEGKDNFEKSMGRKRSGENCDRRATNDTLTTENVEMSEQAVSSQFSSDVSLQVSKNGKQIPPLKECRVLLNSEETTNISSAGHLKKHSMQIKCPECRRMLSTFQSLKDHFYSRHGMVLSESPIVGPQTLQDGCEKSLTKETAEKLEDAN